MNPVFIELQKVVFIELQEVVNERQLEDDRNIAVGLEKYPSLSFEEIQRLLERTIEKNIKKSHSEHKEYIEWLENGHKYDPEDFICPISGDVFNDPVSFGGHIYDYDYLIKWFETDPTHSSPLTRKTLSKKGEPLEIRIPNYKFRRELALYKKKLSKELHTCVAAAAAAEE
jgi:hypothetical protein